jgi:hypothetical protein
MKVSISDERRAELIEKILGFVKHGKQHAL